MIKRYLIVCVNRTTSHIQIPSVYKQQLTCFISMQSRFSGVTPNDESVLMGGVTASTTVYVWCDF